MTTGLLTVASVLQCPHGAPVLISTPRSAPTASGAVIVTIADTFSIAGCPFTLPGPVPSPCVRVQWVAPNPLTSISSVPSLTAQSVGLCLAASGLPQGPVSVTSA
ncbi:MAG TPA: hypothetical protein VFN08_10715 [Gemmatimonadales bacterium]|jgi:hypothetical protein|nr:hypothetical protein [Gemmatimonadales bacterium]